MKNAFLVLTACLTLAACNSMDEVTTDGSYTTSINAYSDGDNQYEGAYNNFTYRATIMNNPIQQTYIQKKGEVYLWDEGKKQSELGAIQAGNGEKTQVFLSFFTPNRWDDNLGTKKSIWTVYLETSQGRYEGKVTRIRTSLTELAVLYPYHNRFSTPYSVEFPVAVNNIENEETKLTITGPLGVKTVKFPAKQNIQ